MPKHVQLLLLVLVSKGTGHAKTCLGRQGQDVDVWFLPIRNPAVERGGWSASRSGCFATGKEPVITWQEVGWASEPVCMSRNILLALGFDPPTIKHAASHYSGYAIPVATNNINTNSNTK
jgi:hypothetical protein